MSWTIDISNGDREVISADGHFIETGENIGGPQLQDLVNAIPAIPESLRVQLFEEFTGDEDFVIPERDPFRLWVPDVVSMLQSERENEFSAIGGDVSWTGDELIWQGRNDASYSRVFNYPTSIGMSLIPGLNYEIRYVPESPVEYPPFDFPWKSVREVRMNGWPYEDWEMVLKYVAYFEDEGGRLDATAGEVPIYPNRAQFTPDPSAGPAMLIGQVIGRYFRGSPEAERSDPAFTTRENEILNQLERRYSSREALRIAFPCLESSEVLRLNAKVVVFVHGTASHGYKYLNTLEEFRGRLVFYNHDTFKSIRDNAEDLADKIMSKLPDARVILIGHSRGGLVARASSALLLKHGRETELITFGTPHNGSELIGFGEATIRGFFPRKLARTLIRAKGVAVKIRGRSSSAIDEMLGEILSRAPLPMGWRDMEYQGSVVKMLADMSSPKIFESIGSTFDAQRSHASQIEKLLLRIVPNPNDIVVSMQSANAEGTPVNLGLTCGHTNYFESTAVLEHMRRSLLR